eukprot:scaffold391_cov157-Skeletonema_menzelii.AAC.4
MLSWVLPQLQRARGGLIGNSSAFMVQASLPLRIYPDSCLTNIFSNSDAMSVPFHHVVIICTA